MLNPKILVECGATFTRNLFFELSFPLTNSSDLCSILCALLHCNSFIRAVTSNEGDDLRYTRRWDRSICCHKNRMQEFTLVLVLILLLMHSKDYANPIKYPGWYSQLFCVRQLFLILEETPLIAKRKHTVWRIEFTFIALIADYWLRLSLWWVLEKPPLFTSQFS